MRCKHGLSRLGLSRATVPPGRVTADVRGLASLGADIKWRALEPRLGFSLALAYGGGDRLPSKVLRILIGASNQPRNQRASRVALTRREALAGGFCLCCLPGSAVAVPRALTEVGPGIFVRAGLHQEATLENAGGIANVGVIVGRDCVLVTDACGSLADGEWLRGEIRKRTDKPIRYVLITHVHPDHSFGAAAFAADQPAVIGHHALRPALAARGEFYRRHLADALGSERAGSVVYPTEEVKDGMEIDLGGRVLRLIAHGKAHTDCDLSMLDVETGLLFPADLLFVHRLPSLDGSLRGWLSEVERLKKLGVTRAVPGHGPLVVDFAPAIGDLVRYLSILRDETRKAIAAGMSIAEAGRTVAETERRRWALFDDYNERNVIAAYKELEWE